MSQSMLVGTDLGPSPGDLIRMSLASCMAITMRMYANRKGFPVTAIEVRVFSEDVNGTLFTAKSALRAILTRLSAREC